MVDIAAVIRSTISSEATNLAKRVPIPHSQTISNMMMTKTAAPSLVLLVCLASIWDGLLYNHGGVHGFTTTSSLSVGTMISSSSSLSSTVGGRRSFLETSVVMTTSVLFFPLVVAPPPVLAADTDSVDDLSMPTEEEIQKSEVRCYHLVFILFHIILHQYKNFVLCRIYSPFSTL